MTNGSIQLEGVDVDETFSPVVKSGTIQTVLSLATSRHYSIHQLDVKNSFLHGDLYETVYMHQYLGIQDPVHPNYETHFSTLKRILRYVQGLLDHGLKLFSSSTTFLVAYSDADWTGCPTTQSVEAEYCGVANAIAETCCLRNLLHELHTPLYFVTLVYYDNVSAVVPPKEGQPSNAQAVQALKAWKHLDFLCHNYILNGLVDSLCNVYYKTMTAKELWESLECKYKTKDADDNKLAHKNTYIPNSAKANMAEHAGSSSKSNSKAKGKGKRKNDKKRKGKVEYLAPKVRVVKQMLQGTCYNCDQPGHCTANCKMPKRVTPRQANMTRILEHNEEIKKSIILTSNTPYPSKKIRRICANFISNHKDMKLNTPYPEDAIRRIQDQVMEYNNCGAYAKKPQYAILNMFNTAYRPNFRKIGSSSRLYDEVVQDKRQQDGNDLQDESQDQPKEEEVKPRRSKRARTEKSFGPDFVSFMVENEPTSYQEAKKMKADGTIDKYKARLVIKGFRQREGTQPDLAYAVSKLSTYNSNPSNAQWKAMARVLYYLRYSRDYGLHYERYSAVIEGYIDAN
nr:ribonuclease H-like domain-containing protein [Tanacetum cinerariifolium]